MSMSCFLMQLLALAQKLRDLEDILGNRVANHIKLNNKQVENIVAGNIEELVCIDTSDLRCPSLLSSQYLPDDNCSNDGTNLSSDYNPVLHPVLPHLDDLCITDIEGDEIYNGNGGRGSLSQRGMHDNFGLSPGGNLKEIRQGGEQKGKHKEINSLIPVRNSLPLYERTEQLSEEETGKDSGDKVWEDSEIIGGSSIRGRGSGQRGRRYSGQSERSGSGIVGRIIRHTGRRGHLQNVKGLKKGFCGDNGVRTLRGKPGFHSRIPRPVKQTKRLSQERRHLPSQPYFDSTGLASSELSSSKSEDESYFPPLSSFSSHLPPPSLPSELHTATSLNEKQAVPISQCFHKAAPSQPFSSPETKPLMLSSTLSTPFSSLELEDRELLVEPNVALPFNSEYECKDLDKWNILLSSLLPGSVINEQNEPISDGGKTHLSLFSVGLDQDPIDVGSPGSMRESEEVLSTPQPTDSPSCQESSDQLATPQSYFNDYTPLSEETGPLVATHHYDDADVSPQKEEVEIEQQLTPAHLQGFSQAQGNRSEGSCILNTHIPPMHQREDSHSLITAYPESTHLSSLIELHKEHGSVPTALHCQQNEACKFVDTPQLSPLHSGNDKSQTLYWSDISQNQNKDEKLQNAQSSLIAMSKDEILGKKFNAAPRSSCGSISLPHSLDARQFSSGKPSIDFQMSVNRSNSLSETYYEHNNNMSLSFHTSLNAGYQGSGDQMLGTVHTPWTDPTPQNLDEGHDGVVTGLTRHMKYPLLEAKDHQNSSHTAFMPGHSYRRIRVYSDPLKNGFEPIKRNISRSSHYPNQQMVSTQTNAVYHTKHVNSPSSPFPSDHVLTSVCDLHNSAVQSSLMVVTTPNQTSTASHSTISLTTHPLDGDICTISQLSTPVRSPLHTLPVTAIGRSGDFSVIGTPQLRKPPQSNSPSQIADDVSAFNQNNTQQSWSSDIHSQPVWPSVGNSGLHRSSDSPSQPIWSSVDDSQLQSSQDCPSQPICPSVDNSQLHWSPDHHSQPLWPSVESSQLHWSPDHHSQPLRPSVDSSQLCWSSHSHNQLALLSEGNSHLHLPPESHSQQIQPPEDNIHDIFTPSLGNPPLPIASCNASTSYSPIGLTNHSSSLDGVTLKGNKLDTPLTSLSCTDSSSTLGKVKKGTSQVYSQSQLSVSQGSTVIMEPQQRKLQKSEATGSLGCDHYSDKSFFSSGSNGQLIKSPDGHSQSQVVLEDHGHHILPSEGNTWPDITPSYGCPNLCSLIGSTQHFKSTDTLDGLIGRSHQLGTPVRSPSHTCSVTAVGEETDSVYSMAQLSDSHDSTQLEAPHPTPDSPSWVGVGMSAFQLSQTQQLSWSSDSCSHKNKPLEGNDPPILLPENHSKIAWSREGQSQLQFPSLCHNEPPSQVQVVDHCNSVSDGNSQPPWPLEDLTSYELSLWLNTPALTQNSLPTLLRSNAALLLDTYNCSAPSIGTQISDNATPSTPKSNLSSMSLNDVELNLPSSNQSISDCSTELQPIIEKNSASMANFSSISTPLSSTSGLCDDNVPFWSNPNFISSLHDNITALSVTPTPSQSSYDVHLSRDNSATIHSLANNPPALSEESTPHWTRQNSDLSLDNHCNLFSPLIGISGVSMATPAPSCFVTPNLTSCAYSIVGCDSRLEDSSFSHYAIPKTDNKVESQQNIIRVVAKSVKEPEDEIDKMYKNSSPDHGKGKGKTLYKLIRCVIASSHGSRRHPLESKAESNVGTPKRSPSPTNSHGQGQRSNLFSPQPSNMNKHSYLHKQPDGGSCNIVDEEREHSNRFWSHSTEQKKLNTLSSTGDWFSSTEVSHFHQHKLQLSSPAGIRNKGCRINEQKIPNQPAQFGLSQVTNSSKTPFQSSPTPSTNLSGMASSDTSDSQDYKADIGDHQRRNPLEKMFMSSSSSSHCPSPTDPLNSSHASGNTLTHWSPVQSSQSTNPLQHTFCHSSSNASPIQSYCSDIPLEQTFSQPSRRYNFSIDSLPSKRSSMIDLRQPSASINKSCQVSGDCTTPHLSSHTFSSCHMLSSSAPPLWMPQAMTSSSSSCPSMNCLTSQDYIPSPPLLATPETSPSHHQEEHQQILGDDRYFGYGSTATKQYHNFPASVSGNNRHKHFFQSPDKDKWVDSHGGKDPSLVTTGTQFSPLRFPPDALFMSRARTPSNSSSDFIHHDDRHSLSCPKPVKRLNRSRRQHSTSPGDDQSSSDAGHNRAYCTYSLTHRHKISQPCIASSSRRSHPDVGSALTGEKFDRNRIEGLFRSYRSCSLLNVNKKETGIETKRSKSHEDYQLDQECVQVCMHTS